MNSKRAKYIATTSAAGKEGGGGSVVPVIIHHDPNAGPGQPQYTYATFATADEAEAAVASLSGQGEHHDVLANAQEVIIDEHGRALTIQQLVTDDHHTVEEVETVEEVDGSHTILHIVPSSPDGVDGGDVENVVVETSDGGLDDGDASLSPSDPNAARSKTFYCPNCGNCYSAPGSLKLHMRACMRQRQEVPPEDRKCLLCNKVFNSVSYLKEHMMRHTGEGPRRCTRCYRKFIDDDKWKAHLESHKQQDKLDAEAEALAAQHGGKKVVVKEFNCSFCSQTFSVVFDAGQVKRRYACDTCREKYSNAEMLKRHKQLVDDKREYPCERCGRKFVFEGFLQRHLPTCDGTIKRRRDMK